MCSGACIAISDNCTEMESFSCKIRKMFYGYVFMRFCNEMQYN